MNINDYQNDACNTAVYPNQYAIMYPALGLAGEVGEVCNKIKKIFRDNEGRVSIDVASDLESELGDVLWYLAVLAADLELDLGEIAEKNLEKLASRAERGTLQGSGDNR